MAHISKFGYPDRHADVLRRPGGGFIYISSMQKYREKIHHLIANPKISVSISNDGANLRRQKAIQIIGHAEVSTDDAMMRKVHWAIIDKYWSEVKDPEQRQAAFNAVHTPQRAIIKVIPEKTILLGLRQDGR